MKVIVGNPVIILFITRSGQGENASEAAIIARLEAFGFFVETLSAADSTSADAEGKEGIIISSTTSSSQVADKFLSVATPVLNWEAFIQDDMLMTGTGNGADYGEIFDFSELVIVDPDHPMAGGLAEGLHEVTTSPQRMMWGSPVAVSYTHLTLPTICSV